MSTGTALIPSALQNHALALPEDVRRAFVDVFGAAMQSYNGVFNVLAIKGGRFRLRSGGEEKVLEQAGLNVVILGIGAENYNAWYKDGYDEKSSDNVPPTALWGENDEVPSNVPASVLQKDEKGFNKYAIRRRMVVALADVNAEKGTATIDTEKLYIFDVNAKSNFGSTIAMGNISAYGLGGYVNYLNSKRIFPAMLLTRIVFDTSESVPAVRFIPMCNAQNEPVLLNQINPELLNDVIKTIQDKKVAPLLEVKKTGATEGQTVNPQAPAEDPNDAAKVAAAVDAKIAAALDAQEKAEQEKIAAELKARQDAELKAKIAAEEDARRKEEEAMKAPISENVVMGSFGDGEVAPSTTTRAPENSAPAPANLSGALGTLLAGSTFD